MNLRKSVFTAIFFILITAMFAVPSIAVEEKADPGSAWNIYFRPGVRFGTESRVLYIMDFLVPLYQDEKNIVFSNIKYTPNNHDGWELNAGLGYRRLLWDNNLILGVNAYYDKRRTDWGTNHEQWGVGLEAMADIPLKPFDLGLTGRFNYYYPLSHTKIDGLGTPYATYTLSDSGIILNGGRVEEPMRGFDYELGMRIPYVSDYVETWAYAGGYHYKGRRVRDINGFQTRLEIIPTDFIRLNYEFHHDNYSKAEHYGEITFELPFSIGNLVTVKNPFEGIGDMLTGSRELSARMVEPTRRDVDVKVIVDEDNDNIPSGGDEIEDIVFVSETGSDVTGDGTVGNPYATISYALASDPRILAGACKTIHVMNSSTTAVVDEAAGAGLTLAISDFLLWGSGANHPTHPVSNMPYSGHPTVNDTLSLDAANPTVTGLGFDMTNTGNSAIEILAGTGNGGLTITNNSINIVNNGVAYGIYLNCFGGGIDVGTPTNPIIIANNEINVESTNDYAYGFYLWNGGDLYGTFNDNLITVRANNGAYGFYTGVGCYYDLNVDFTGNTINIPDANDGTGIYVHRCRSDNTTYTTNFANNDIDIVSDSSAYGIYLSAGRGSDAILKNTFIGNTINLDAVDYALGISFDKCWGNNTTFTNTFIGNTINVDADNNSANGISLEFHAGNNRTINNTFTGNMLNLTSTSGYIDGISLEACLSSDTSFTNTFVGNTLLLNSGGGGIYGIYTKMGSGSNRTFTNYVSGNTIEIDADNYAYGFYSEACRGDDDTFVGTFTNNNIVLDAVGEARGIYYKGGGNGTNNEFSTVFAGNQIDVESSAGDAYGIWLFAGCGRDIISTISGNSILVSGNNAFGVHLYADNDIFANIKHNYMNVTASDTAYGAYITAGNLIGDVTSLATFFYKNSGTINGATDRYMLWLETGFSTGGNFVNWSGNEFTPVGGGWSGSYGPANEVGENFGAGDILVP